MHKSTLIIALFVFTTAALADCLTTPQKFTYKSTDVVQQRHVIKLTKSENTDLQAEITALEERGYRCTSLTMDTTCTKFLNKEEFTTPKNFIQNIESIMKKNVAVFTKKYAESEVFIQLKDYMNKKHYMKGMIFGTKFDYILMEKSARSKVARVTFKKLLTDHVEVNAGMICKNGEATLTKELQHKKVNADKSITEYTLRALFN
jgi:hypothetical protein